MLFRFDPIQYYLGVTVVPLMRVLTGA